MSGTALVTGANGFVGSHLTDLLLERGWRVRCLVRRTSDLSYLPVDRVDLLYGEASDARAIASAVPGADVVFHAAGIMRAPTLEAYVRVNAAGCANVARAAAAARKPPSRILCVSSLAAGGPSPAGARRTEADEDRPLDLYGESKLLGERELKANAGSVPWTVIRPPAVYGPRDRGFLVLARLAARGWAVRFSGPEQAVSVIHARDLAEGILLAAVSPNASGRTYYLSHDEDSAWFRIARAMGEAIGRPTRPLPVPRGIIPPAARATGLVARLGRRMNPLPPDRVGGLLASGWACSAARARGDFGFEARRPNEEGFRETMLWYRSEGWLR